MKKITLLLTFSFLLSLAMGQMTKVKQPGVKYDSILVQITTYPPTWEWEYYPSDHVDTPALKSDFDSPVPLLGQDHPDITFPYAIFSDQSQSTGNWSPRWTIILPSGRQVDADTLFNMIQKAAILSNRIDSLITDLKNVPRQQITSGVTTDSFTMPTSPAVSHGDDEVIRSYSAQAPDTLLPVWLLVVDTTHFTSSDTGFIFNFILNAQSFPYWPIATMMPGYKLTMEEPWAELDTPRKIMVYLDAAQKPLNKNYIVWMEKPRN